MPLGSSKALHTRNKFNFKLLLIDLSQQGKSRFEETPPNVSLLLKIDYLLVHVQ